MVDPVELSRKKYSGRKKLTQQRGRRHEDQSKQLVDINSQLQGHLNLFNKVYLLFLKIKLKYLSMGVVGLLSHASSGQSSLNTSFFRLIYRLMNLFVPPASPIHLLIIVHYTCKLLSHYILI